MVYFSKAVKSKIYLFIFLLIIAVMLYFFLVRSLEKNVVYFFSPTEIYNDESISLIKKIRVGGLVKIGSVNKNDNSLDFIVTDLKNEIIVNYTGIVPNLFLEGKGVVAEGILKDKKYFIAEQILAKHDENYMPPEVSISLDRS